MFTRTVLRSASAALAIVALFAGSVLAQPPSLEGTYRLVSRQLPDGTVRTASDASGFLTFTKNHRNLEIVWKGTNGILCTYSLAARYKFDNGKYSEKVLFSSMNDYLSGQGKAFDLVNRHQKVNVIQAADYGASKPAIDTPTMIVDGNQIIATAEGSFIDTWEKVDQESNGAQASNPEQ